MRKKDMSEYERIAFKMTVLERQIQSRAGQWIVKNGKCWDEGLHAYVIHCAHCKHLFLAQRSDKKTCSESCKKKRLAKTRKTNLKREGKNGQMKLGRAGQQ